MNPETLQILSQIISFNEYPIGWNLKVAKKIDELVQLKDLHRKIEMEAHIRKFNTTPIIR